jgi:hypothetical protein
MTYRFCIVSIAALALVGCHKENAATNGQGVNNITVYDANTLPPDANITDVPADDGDAPTEAETNAK